MIMLENVICEVINDTDLKNINVYNSDIGKALYQCPENRDGVFVKFPHIDKPVQVFMNEINLIVKK